MKLEIWTTAAEKWWIDSFFKGEQESGAIVISSGYSFYCWLAISLSIFPNHSGLWCVDVWFDHRLLFPDEMSVSQSLADAALTMEKAVLSKNWDGKSRT